MATFHCNASNGRASKRAGGKHSRYQAGVGRYADKTEVVFSQDFNIPYFATNAIQFFDEADKNERANGRSYKALIVAIPNEAQDPQQWSVDFAKKVLGDQAGFLSVHMKDGNRHLHLMINERTNTQESKALSPEKYFSRANKKVAFFSDKQWLKDTKVELLKHIQTVAPGYVPTMQGGKEKQLHRKDLARLKDVREHRELVKQINEEEALIKKLMEELKHETTKNRTKTPERGLLNLRVRSMDGNVQGAGVSVHRTKLLELRQRRTDEADGRGGVFKSRVRVRKDLLKQRRNTGRDTSSKPMESGKQADKSPSTRDSDNTPVRELREAARARLDKIPAMPSIPLKTAPKATPEPVVVVRKGMSM
jgi:MobA/MobL family